MEFVDKLLAQSKFSSQDKKDFTIQLHKKVVADKHDMSTKERMGIVQDCFSSIIKSTIQNVPDSDEIDLFKKCVRKNTRARIRMMKYYNELMNKNYLRLSASALVAIICCIKAINCQCPAGQYLLSTSCSPCNAGKLRACCLGYYCLGGAFPNLCPVGQSQASSGQISCNSCPVGQVQPSVGQSSCNLCPAGQFQPLTGQTICNPCPAGYAQPFTGQASCNDCGPGTSSTAGSASCTPCSINYYNALSNKEVCTPCPDGYKTLSTGSTFCIPICGDGKRKIGEECDDGDTQNGDGCSSICNVETGYKCIGGEDGVSIDVCSPLCGDGLVYGNEQCDDNNYRDGDGCSSSCTYENFFLCSGGSLTTRDYCIDLCGDGFMYLKTPTNCDDGNLINGDGCDSNCAVEPGYTCFGGTRTTKDKCITVCGDGVLTPDEQCDDGNIQKLDGCSDLCKIEDGFACTQGQAPPLPWTHCVDICGDGRIFGTTECDDGNLVDGDGCSSTCTIEIGHQCIGGSSTSKSVCSEICGDGLNFHTMECDDGNSSNDDGCDVSCKYEKCYQCIGGSPIGKDICSIYKITTTVKHSSNSEVTVVFSNPIEAKTISSSDMTISISANYAVTFTYDASLIDSTHLKISISIPTILTGSEVMTIKLNDWKKFRGKYGGCVDPEVIKANLQDNLQDSTDQVKSSSLYAQIIMYLCVLINIGMSILLGSSMSKMLCLINWMQLVCYLPLMTSYFPEHVKVMYSYLAFSNMDIDIFTEAFKKLTYVSTENVVAFNQRFEDNNVSSVLFFDNSASILFSLLLTICSLILLVFIYFIACFPLLKLWAKNTISSYFFNNTLLFIIQGFLELLFGCTLNAISFEASTITEVSSYLFSVICLMILIFVMCIISAILYDKRKVLNEEDKPYIKRIGNLFTELRNDRWYQIQFYPIFLARRLFFILLIIFCSSYSEIQMNMFILSTLLMWFYSIYCKPYKDSSINFLNSVNECSLFIICIIQILFDTNIKDKIIINIAGWIMISCCITNILINFSFTFGSHFYNKIKACFKKKPVAPVSNIMTDDFFVAPSNCEQVSRLHTNSEF